MTVLRLSGDDLQTQHRATLATGTMVTIADRLLVSVVADRSGVAATRKYTLPDLTLVDPEAGPVSVYSRAEPARRLADGWLLDGVLWDDDLRTPKLLVSAGKFQRLALPTAPPGVIQAEPILHGYTLFATPGAAPSPRDLRSERPRYTPHLPNILSFHRTNGRAHLDFRDLAGRVVLRSETLREGVSPLAAFPFRYPDEAHVTTAPHQVFVTYYGHVYVLPAAPQSEMQLPFRIEPRQELLVLPTGQKVAVSYAAANAMKFELELPGLSAGPTLLTSKTGEFELDLTTIEDVLQSTNETNLREGRTREGDFAKWAQTYTEQVRQDFRKLVGRDPTGVPFAISASVRAYGKDLSTAVMQHVYLVEMPFPGLTLAPLAAETAASAPQATTAPAARSVSSAQTPGNVATAAESQNFEPRHTAQAPPSIELPFAVSGIAVSPDGRRAVAWDRGARAAPPPPRHLALIDLTGPAVLAETEIKGQLHDVVLDNEHVFVLSERTISRYSRADLTPNGSVATGSSGGQLQLVATRRLSLGPRARFALADLQPLPNYDHDVHSSEGWLDGRTGFGWMEEGILWNSSLDKPLLLVWPYEFQRVPWQDVLQHSMHEPGEFEPSIGTWHPFATKLRAKLPSPLKGIASADIPATLAIVETGDACELVSYELDTGQRIASVTLGPKVAPPDRGDGGDVKTAPGKYVVRYANRLFVGSLDHLQPQRLPFHIVPRQSRFVLSPDRPTSVQYEAAGARRFRLTSRSLGRRGQLFAAESTTGQFSISLAESLDGIIESSALLAANLPQGRDLNNAQRIESFARPAVGAFQRLSGRKPPGVPLVVAVQVTAEGKDFETAVLRHDYLVIVPPERLEEVLDKKWPDSRDPTKKPKGTE